MVTKDKGPELTIAELRETITSIIRRLESGETTPAVANGIANLGGKLLGTYKLQIEYARILGKTPHIDALMPPAGEGEGRSDR